MHFNKKLFFYLNVNNQIFTKIYRFSSSLSRNVKNCANYLFQRPHFMKVIIHLNEKDDDG